MTAAHVETSTLELVALDEAWAIPCCVRKPHGCGGDRAAVWIAIPILCCPAPKVCLYCTPCKDMMLTVPGGLWCNHCETHFMPASTAFRSIEPLNPGGVS